MSTLTEAQRLTVEALKRQGFAEDQRSRSVIRMKRGNDYRLVQLNGAQKRAVGAKR